jgi:hypothetical protein
MKGIEVFDLELKDFARPLNMMNPESQKIGNPVINPVIAKAEALLCSPVFESIYLAILIVPPVLSRVMPIIAPRIMRNPIDAIVLPNPSLIVLTIVLAGRVVNARKRETRNRAINALSFSFEVRIIIAIILTPTYTDFNRMLIDKTYLKKRSATKIAVVNSARSVHNP